MPETIPNRREVFRDAFPMQARIAALLREGPRTVPELAAMLGAPTDQVLVWLTAMLRYGSVESKGKADAEGYYTYALKEVRP